MENAARPTALWICPLVAVFGCVAEVDDRPTTFVGEALDGEVVVASFWGEDGAILYTCGRGDTLDSSTGWVRVAREPEQQDVLFSTPGFELMATREVDALRGVLTRGDESDMLELAPALSLENVGVFQTVDGECRTAAIALRGAGGLRIQGAHFCAPEGPFFQVTPIRPPELLGETLRVSFDDGSGVREQVLMRFAGL